jgi:hypothetical protein
MLKLGGSIFANRQAFGKRVGYERSRAFTALEISFCQKLRVCIENGYARDGQFYCQRSGGRNPLARPQVATHNFQAKAIIDLFVKRMGRLPVHRDNWRDGLSYFCHTTMVVVISDWGKLVINADHPTVSEYGTQKTPAGLSIAPRNFCVRGRRTADPSATLGMTREGRLLTYISRVGWHRREPDLARRFKVGNHSPLSFLPQT